MNNPLAVCMTSRSLQPLNMRSFTHPKLDGPAKDHQAVKNDQWSMKLGHNQISADRTRVKYDKPFFKKDKQNTECNTGSEGPDGDVFDDNIHSEWMNIAGHQTGTKGVYHNTEKKSGNKQY